MQRQASISAEDIDYTWNYDGYMMQYKGQNIGGAGRKTDGYTTPRKNKKDLEHSRQQAEITKRDILDGRIPSHMQEAIDRIDQETSSQKIEGSLILGSVEISDQMLDKDGMWIARELWEPEISYRIEQIEMSLGQIERGVNVTAQIRNFIDDLNEILEKIPNDQLTSAQDYISEQMNQKPDILSVVQKFFGKTAGDIADKPITELNKILKKKDEENMRMQNPEEKGRMREPSNPQTVQQDVNIDARNTTPLAGVTLQKGNTVRILTGKNKNRHGIVGAVTEGIGVRVKVGSDSMWYNAKALEQVIPAKLDSEFSAIEADIKSGFKQIIDEIETSNNPYVVNEIGRKLYKQHQRDNEIVREGNVSRILP